MKLEEQEVLNDTMKREGGRSVHVHEQAFSYANRFLKTAP